MQVFIYPGDYLSKKGNIKHCWEVHVKKMKESGQPYVDYFGFYNRIRRYNRDLYRAIHTPLDYTNLDWNEKTKIWLRTQRFRFIYLFKPNDMRRSKRHKNSC